MSGFTVSSTVEAVAIGNFDGMHRGHQALFEQVGPNGGIVVIEHYRATLTPHVYRTRFTDLPLFFYDFDRICDMNPDVFLEKLRFDFPSLRRIVVGEDFLFGAGRSGNVATLEMLFDGEVIAVPEMKLKEEPVHSRFIRIHIAKGEIETANAMLGHPYEIWGEAVAGQGIGKEELVPTINLETGRFLLPKAGVYETQTCIGSVCCPSVTFVGHRETTDGSFAVETHLIDHEIGEVKEKISIKWLHRLRENRKFDSLAALKRQIEKDIEAVREKR
jgi:riboflavin kinase/FMN adenylyltransferase